MQMRNKYFGEWENIIDKTELKNIINRLSIEYKTKSICPDQHNVFKAFELCPYSELKVVFLGQDPYCQKNIATGILFGNKNGIKEKILSPSLQVIKEAVIDFEIPHNPIIFDPTLESWAKQGILMINSALTVEMNKVGSHTLLWRPFMAGLLKNLSIYNSGIIYVLFGKQAQSFKSYINSRSNIILEEDHPAYYARVGKRMPSKVFKSIDKLVKDKYGESIIWYNELI